MKLLPALLLLWAGTATARDLQAVYYDYLLVDFCDLATSEVLAGYRSEVAVVASRDGLDVSAQQSAASAAAVAFEREWGNRGLGGSRPWCRDEGRNSASRLASGGTAAQP